MLLRLRLVTKVQSYYDKLITLHDELADLKSYFDGVKHSANPKPDQKNLCSKRDIPQLVSGNM